MPNSEIEQLSIDTIRTLSMDAVQNAESGHPGTPMALAPVVYTLWQRFLRFDPDQPIWPNRDRFVLSNGHASMLLYSMLHLAGVKQVKDTYVHRGEFAVTLDDIKREIRRSLTAEKVVNKEITSKINITDQDIADYYNAHRAEFNLIEPRYHLAHILVTTSPDPQGRDPNKARNEPDARKKIDSVLARLQAGEDFATLASTYSEDTATAANGGDIGIVPESALKQADVTTRDAVMKLKPGQFTPVIPLAGGGGRQVAGFRIVKLIAVEPAGVRELSDQHVKQQIRQQLQDRREQLLKTAYYEVMRNQAKIDNYYAQGVLAAGGAGH